MKRATKKSRGNIPHGIPLRYVAAAIDTTDEDTLEYVFRNADRKVVERAFGYLSGNGRGICESFSTQWIPDIQQRANLTDGNLWVKVKNPNERFCSLEEQKILISAVMQRMGYCKVEWMGINALLNA